MNQRNWLQLSRKLVDQYDLEYTLDSLQSILGQQALSFFGEGVLVTTLFPNPFIITMSGSLLGGSVGNGIGYDNNGNLTEITPSSVTSKDFTIGAAHPTLPRWDLLVIDHIFTGDTPVPKPSDPITTIDLNLHDDFALIVRPGVPSASPAYPAKQAQDIILAGLKVPAAATLGTQVTVDLSIREIAQRNQAAFPIFREENLPGANGVQQTFTLTYTPISNGSLAVFLDDLFVDKTQYSVTGNQITFNTPPAVGVDIEVFYIEDSPSSENPLAGQDENLGSGNGVKTQFDMVGNPANQSGVWVFVNGRKIPPTEFSFLQNPMNGSIVFNSAPAIGQIVDVFYFVNAASVGVGLGATGVTGASNLGTGTGGVGFFDSLASGILKFLSAKAGANMTIAPDGLGHVVFSASGGGYSRTTFGNFTSPISIDPAVGIVPTADQDQTWWVVPNVPGAQTVTATPQIAAGTTVGQRLTLKGASGSDYLIIDTGTGVSQNGIVNITDAQSIAYEWDGSRWAEDTRRL